MKTLFLKSNLLHIRLKESEYLVENPYLQLWVDNQKIYIPAVTLVNLLGEIEWTGGLEFCYYKKVSETWIQCYKSEYQDNEDYRKLARLIPEEKKAESAYKEVESSEPQEKPRRQEFEKYPVLTEHISRMYHTGTIGSLIEWSNFLQELNRVLKVSAHPESQEDMYNEVRQEYLKHRGRIWTKEEVMLKWIIENYKLITRKPE